MNWTPGQSAFISRCSCSSPFPRKPFSAITYTRALRKLKLPDWLWAALISLLFGALHLYNNQIVVQFWIATVFSLYVFGLKLSRRRETYCTLAVTHYVYNLCWFYLFGMAV